MRLEKVLPLKFKKNKQFPKFFEKLFFRATVSYLFFENAFHTNHLSNEKLRLEKNNLLLIQSILFPMKYSKETSSIKAVSLLFLNINLCNRS